MLLYKKKRIRFVDLLLPGNQYSWWDIGDQKVFGIYSWMVSTGEQYQTYGKSGPREMLSGMLYIYNTRKVLPFTSNWREELWMRFHYAILEPGNNIINTWRKENNIDVGNCKILPLPWYGEIFNGKVAEVMETSGLIDSLFIKSNTLKISPNQYHPDATSLRSVVLQPLRGLHSWCVLIEYGCPEDPYSGWDIQINMKENELFYDFVKRAGEEIQDLCVNPVEYVRVLNTI